MRKLLSTIFFITLAQAISFEGQSQTFLVDSLVKRFDNYRQADYPEKIYLHVNQSSFLVGETVWFSVYAVDGSVHKETQLSKIAYVEILDRNNVSIAQGKIGLIDGHGSGSFYLSPLINSGSYVIRAYTNWMRNHDAAYYYHKTVQIINTFTPLERKKETPPVEKIEAEFFPEGGNLIAGATNKVGFRLTANGIGFQTSGAIINDKNDTIVKFTPLKFGIGNFTFQPETGTQYRALIKGAGGDYTSFNLITSKAGGHVLSVADQNDHFLATIENKTGTQWPTFMIVHARNKIIISRMIEDNGQRASLKISKSELPDGVSVITLFNANQQPIAERLIYKRPTQKLEIAAKTNQRDYSPRRPVTVNLETSSAAHLSVSVYRQDSIGTSSGSSILDYLLLSSDLKGSIEFPEYYLSNDAHVDEAIDNLMLTHGWRKFNWSDVAEKKRPAYKYVAESNAPIVTAKVLNENQEPVGGILTYLASPSKSPRIYPSRSSADGTIQFQVRNLYGARKLVIQPNTKTDSTYHITLESPFSNDFAAVRFPELLLRPSSKDALQTRSVAMQVNDIYHRAKHEKFSQPKTDSLPFYGKPDEQYELDEFTRFPVMEEVLREYVPGVVVRKRRDGFHFLVIDHPSKTVFTESPLMLIDGVPFFDEDEIMSFNPLKIKQLDVMTQRYYLGYHHYFGLVSFRTYNGDLGGFVPNKHALVVDFDGLQLQREFYSPRYDTPKDRESRLPDQRQQLYWNPQVITTANGSQVLNFSTSDLTGNYVIVIEGLSIDGTPGTTTTSFTVKNYNN